MVAEFSSTLGMIFPHIFFQISSYNPDKSNILKHLHHLSKGLDNYIGNYDNILLLGDFNSEFSEPCLNDFCDIYNLKNLVKEPTCFKKPDNPSCIDLFLTNRSRTSQCTTTIETAFPISTN